MGRGDQPEKEVREGTEAALAGKGWKLCERGA